MPFLRHCGVSHKLNDLGFHLQNTKPSVEQLRKMWAIFQRTLQVLISVLMFILIQTSELWKLFDANAETCFVCICKCVHLHLSLTHWCILQYSFSFCVYCQESWWIWHFDHVVYSCSCEVGFPHKAQQPFHRMFSGHTGSRCTSPVEQGHYPWLLCQKH